MVEESWVELFFRVECLRVLQTFNFVSKSAASSTFASTNILRYWSEYPGCQLSHVESDITHTSTSPLFCE
jgi:hypothetical protein